MAKYEYWGNFNEIGIELLRTSITRRLDSISFDYQTCRTIGPNAIGDTSLGPLYKAWEFSVDNITQQISYRRGTGPVTNLINDWTLNTVFFSFTGDPIVEIDVAFDQSAQPVICAERNNEIWIYWYNPSLAQYEFKFLVAGRTPRVLLDNPFNTTDSDVLLFYIGDGQVKYRIQRELYNTDYIIPNENWGRISDQASVVADIANLYLEETARSTDNRVYLFCSERNPTTGKYELLVRTSAPFPLELHDDLIVYRDLLDVIIQTSLIDGSVDIGNLYTLRNLVSIAIEDLVIVKEISFESLETIRALTSIITQDYVIVQTISTESLETLRNLSSIITQDYVIVAGFQPVESLTTHRNLTSIVTETV